LRDLAARLKQILPEGFGLALGRIGDHRASIFPDEEALVRFAVAQRRREFRAGRLLARQALALVGSPASQILAHDEGDPIWPAGFVGSISHTGDWAGAVAAPACTAAGVGLDLEADRPLDADLRGFVCRSDETRSEPLLAARGIDQAMLRFVAKEACFKAVFPIVRRYIDFLDARVTFDVERDAFRIEVDNWPDAAPIARDLIGRFAHADGLLAAVAHLPVCAER
jgi:4'-phosphopantetheinyl transferase EntD